ncbi:MAG: hypothetical protein ABI416_08265 [Ginsengibacter sp.]
MKKNLKLLVVANTVTLILMLSANIAASIKAFTGQTVAEVSRKYDTLFAPAGYAFIIWGFLFLLSVCFVVFQWIELKENDPRKYIERTGIWFSLSNLANAAWLYFWLNEMIGSSVIVIFFLVLCLILLTVRLRLELDDEPVRAIFFVWWPISFYLGWIMVATAACISAWLVSLGWNGAGLQKDTWTIIIILITCLLYLLLIRKRNMREAAIVGVWSFIAIAFRQWDSHHNIAITAIMAVLILTVAISLHFFKNRFYAIGVKLKRGEWK